MCLCIYIGGLMEYIYRRANGMYIHKKKCNLQLMDFCFSNRFTFLIGFSYSITGRFFFRKCYSYKAWIVSTPPSKLRLTKCKESPFRGLDLNYRLRVWFTPGSDLINTATYSLQDISCGVTSSNIVLYTLSSSECSQA